MTKREMYSMIKTLVDNVEIQAFCDHEIELLNKKASKPTKNQSENAILKDRIVATLAEIAKPVTVTEIMAFNDTLPQSNSKITSMLTQLKSEGRVVNSKEGRKSLYTVA